MAAVRLDLDRACDLFLDHLKVERNLAANTIESYSRDLARLISFLSARGRASVDEVEVTDLIDHLLALIEAELSPRSRARALVAIRGLFRFLVEELRFDGGRLLSQGQGSWAQFAALGLALFGLAGTLLLAREPDDGPFPDS